MLEISILPLVTIVLLYFRTVPTVWYVLFFILLVFQSFDFKTYMTKVIVHDEGYHTRRRLSYMTKVIIHDEGYRT